MFQDRQFISVRQSDDWVHATIRRPERANALGTALATELVAVLADVAAAVADGARGLVLSAATIEKGGKAIWVAGGDLKELAALPDRAAAGEYARTMTRFCRGLEALPVPVVVAVDGAAIGGGAELALAGDVRLATKRTMLEFKQLKVGLATGYGSAKRLVDLVGLGVAQGLLYGTRIVGAEEAQALGLWGAVAADGAALDVLVAATCAELSALAPEAFAAQKTMLRAAVTAHPGATDEIELAAFMEAWGNPAHREFLERFAAKGRV